MCRFLLIKYQQPTLPTELLNKFSDMCQQSRTIDNDWQGDGWGIAWLESDHSWQVTKSLNPIWEDTEKFSDIPSSSIFAIHARSASFEHHKDNIEFNQPYTDDPYAFVFNGLLKGVKLRQPIPGKIGAQKIWHLLQQNLKTQNPEASLLAINQLLLDNVRYIQALNIGLATTDHIYALCQYTPNDQKPTYNQLQAYNQPNLQFICSEPLSGYDTEPMEIGQVIKL